MATHQKRSIQQQLMIAMQHQQANQLAEAEAIYRGLLKSIPSLPEALHFLGLLLHQQGKSVDGIELINRSLLLQPNNAVFHNNFGIVAKTAGDLSTAARAHTTAVALQPTYAEAWFNLAVVHQTTGHQNEAVDAYRKAVSIRPNYTKAHINLASLLRENHEFEESILASRSALAVNPNLTEALVLLADCLTIIGEGQDAEVTLRAAISGGNNDLPLKIALAQVLSDRGKHSELIALCEDITQITTDPDALRACGELVRNIGLHQLSSEYFHKALLANPMHTSTIRSLSSSRRFSSKDEDFIQEARKHFENPDTSMKDRINLSFALGKMLDDCNEFDEAFKYYDQGNRLVHEHLHFDRIKYERDISAIIETFSAELIKNNTLEEYPGSNIPFFIVGMPRSGTTLIEQILASHPSVRSAGELMHLGRLVRSLPSTLNSSIPFPACVSGLDRGRAHQLAIKYLRALPERLDGEQHVTDKMPSNFLYIGVVAMLFPRAKIVHCRRDPVDVCLSIFFQLFDKAYQYAFDFDDIAFYYRQYMRLMDHWAKVLPTRIVEAEYSKLINEQETTSRELFDMVNLQWDDRCLRFNENNTSIRTSSHWQVRQPIYRSSLQRWRNYRKHIGGLLEALDIPA